MVRTDLSARPPVTPRTSPSALHLFSAKRPEDSPPDVQVSLESAERGALLRVIEQHQWVMSRVAAHFGISRNTLYRKIKRHGISLERPIEARSRLL